MRALVYEYLRARAAGAGITHAPEVVLFAESFNSVLRNLYLFVPYLFRLVVFFIDRYPEFIGRNLELYRKEFPRELYGAFLEVVSEGEVAEHLEERVVPGSLPDVFEVVVLASGAHALLAARGPRVGAFVFAEEYLLELHHAGVREKKRRISLWYKAGRRNGLVAVVREVLKEFFSYVIRFHR